MDDNSSMAHSTNQMELHEDMENGPFPHNVFMFVVPFNIPLCILVLAVGTIVLSYYWRNRGTLTNTLFIMITAADLITCVGHLILMICVVLLSYNVIPPISATVCVVMHCVLSLLGYASSIFFNMVLAVLRTVKISFPFHQFNVKALKIAIALVIAFLVSLTVVDVWFAIYDSSAYLDYPYLFLWLNVNFAFVGHNLWWWLDIFIKPMSYEMIGDLQVGLLFLAPIGVVLICLVVQCVVTRLRARARDPDHPALTDWSHVNITVAILSAVFLLCNSGIAALQIYFRGFLSGDFGWNVFTLMITTTLPLLNALLTPLIIFARSRELRGNVMMMLRRAVGVTQAVN